MQLCVSVCIGRRTIIAAANPPPWSIWADWEDWKSHFISEEVNGWELCGMGKQRRLNYRAARCGSWLCSLTLILTPLGTWEEGYFEEDAHLLPETTGDRCHDILYNMKTNQFNRHAINTSWRLYCPMRRQRIFFSVSHTCMLLRCPAV